MEDGNFEIECRSYFVSRLFESPTRTKTVDSLKWTKLRFKLSQAQVKLLSRGDYGLRIRQREQLLVAPMALSVDTPTRNYTLTRSALVQFFVPGNYSSHCGNSLSTTKTDFSPMLGTASQQQALSLCWL